MSAELRSWAVEGIGEISFAHRRFSHVTNAERLNYAAVGKSSSAAWDVPQEARGARGQARSGREV
jgi:hypothetical protein